MDAATRQVILATFAFMAALWAVGAYDERLAGGILIATMVLGTSHVLARRRALGLCHLTSRWAIGLVVSVEVGLVLMVAWMTDIAWQPVTGLARDGAADRAQAFALAWVGGSQSLGAILAYRATPRDERSLPRLLADHVEIADLVQGSLDGLFVALKALLVFGLVVVAAVALYAAMHR